jgi:hypothetical protein
MSELIQQIEYAEPPNHLPHIMMKIAPYADVTDRLGASYATRKIYIFWGDSREILPEIKGDITKQVTVSTTSNLTTLYRWIDACPLEATVEMIKQLYKATDESRATDSLLSRVRELLLSYT